MAQQSTIPRNLFTISIARASPSMSSAITSSGFCTFATCSNTGRMAWTEEIFFSYSSTSGFSNSTFWAFTFVMKYGEMYPRSSFMPSTTSSSCSNVLPSCTVMVPSLPTFSNALVIMSPMWPSPLAAIVATLRMLAGDSIVVACAARSSRTTLAPASMPRLMSMGFMPAATALQPSRKMARARTVAVVVPSPATSLVLLATCLTSCAPTLIIGAAFRSTDLATVTPSLVTFGAPKDCSMTTLRPLGPMVTATASARRLQPSSISARASLPCRMSLAAANARTAAGAASDARAAGRVAQRNVDSMAAGAAGAAGTARSGGGA
mmetsp:Transcript_38677/g.116886  ORF Transcript_38677/g.116886 Transcript_38677/m.116886 type:complete len:321 (-) Transcript_38677:20-982(-)